jgi:hypothetical protein
MLMVMGATGDKKAYQAALLMLAARDPAACEAMDQAGLVNCVTKEDRKLAKSSTAASSKSADAGNGKCVLKGKTLAFRASSGGDRDAELIACKAKYGL